MMKPLRLPLENGKYAYIEVKALFTDCMEVHIVDRTNVKSGVSIMDCIEEIQEAIINEFGAKDFVMNFLKHSKWFLYSKNGKVGEYRTIEGVRELQAFDPVLDHELVALAMERSGTVMPLAAIIPVDMACEQLSLF